MTFVFGAFCLDEPARILRLAERELALQPLVFDLLVYLIQNRARVVSKDELLDTLWPGVTVTDNSLQRAISTLRSVLRKGGMEDAIRNFPRNGYRFCFDGEREEGRNVEDSALSAGNEREAARRATQELRWSDAISLFEKIDLRGLLDGDDLDGWALALQCVGKPSDAIPLLVRAITSHLQAGHKNLAAADAVSLSTIHLERGELAVAKGWLARAGDMTSETPESSAAGLALWMQSRVAGADSKPEEALRLAEAAYEAGRRLGDSKVEALGLMYRGFYRLSLGDTRGGLADQDHAAALSLSDKVDPVTGAVLFCNILWVCRTFGDWSRANQWTLGYRQFCRDSRIEFSGSCQLHRAEVLGIQGSLHDALAHIKDSLARLSYDAPWARGDAYRVLGDIHSAIGDTEAALKAYDDAYALGWCPEPGRAMLLLERGDPQAAYGILEQSLIGQGWWTLQRQGILLAHLALVAVYAGRHEKAEALINELAGQEERWPMPSIRALTNEATALLAQKRGDLNEALRRLHLARQLWTSVDSRLNTARLRLAIARLQLEMGDKSSAGAELRAVLHAAEELGSQKLKTQCEALQRALP